MKIVVTGSLGNIGKPLTMDLVQQGHSVTVISSKPEKQEAIEALGATAAIGSLEDAHFLATAFAGADAVFAMVPPNFAEADQVAYYRRIGSSYAQAIPQSSVKRVVHLSSYAEELTTAATGHRVRYVASDEHTANEAARTLGTAIGKPDLTWVTFTNEQMKGGLEQRGMPPQLVASFVDLGASTHSGVLREDYDQHKPKTMGRIKLADFAYEFAATYNRSE